MMRAPTLLPAVRSLPTVLSQNVRPTDYAGGHPLANPSARKMQPAGDGASSTVLKSPDGILDSSPCAETHIARANQKIVFHSSPVIDYLP